MPHDASTTAAAPLIVGLGGTTAARSSTESALGVALAAAEARGCRTRLFGGAFLARLPLYTMPVERTAEEAEMVSAVRQSAGLIVASPGYHGSLSGLVKNALDLLEDTAGDARPYLTGLPVGLIATAHGWQATGGTIAALRSIVHALRGWPTPFAAAVNAREARFTDAGEMGDPAIAEQLTRVGEQVADFALARWRDPVET